MIKRLGVVLTVGALALALLIAPGQIMGAGTESNFGTDDRRGPIAEEERYEGSAKFEERDELRIQKIEELVEEGAISEEEGDELLEAIEERSSFERGECPADGPRNCEVNLNLRERFENEDDEGTRTGSGFGRRGMGRGFNR